MNSCEKCPYALLKKKFDEGKISFVNKDGSRNDFVYAAFGVAMERFNLSGLNQNCPEGENGCPAIYRRETEKLKN